MKCFRSCLLLAAIASVSVDAFAPMRAVHSTVMTPSSATSSRPGPTFMAETSLQENNSLPKLPTPRWNFDPDTMINKAILFGVAALVLAKVTLIDSDVSRGWTATEVARHMPMGVWNSYIDVLRSSPIATKAVTSASVYAIGDLIAQGTEGKSMGELDRMRTLRSLLAGLIGHGPLSHLWYNFSENIFDNVLHWTAWWSIIPKVALDQSVWSPIWNNSYIIFLGLMKKESLETIWSDIKRTTVPLVVSGLKLWPLAHCVTYGLIPVENRLLWVDFVEIFWVTILASSAAQGTNGAHVSVSDEPFQEEEAGNLVDKENEILISQ